MMLPGTLVNAEPGLKELLDPVGFRGLFEALSDYFKVGMRIIDASGLSLFQVGATTVLCKRVRSQAGGIERCTKTIEAVKNLDLEIGTSVEECFTGCKYVVCPLRHDQKLLGRLVFGPYVPNRSAGIYDPPPGTSPEELMEARNHVTAMEDYKAQEAAELVAKVVDAVAAGGYKVLLTSAMHVESLSESYSRLQEKNRELEKINQKLKELDLLKSNFLATVSHELKTPLTSIIGYSEMLQEGLAGDVNEEQRSYISTIMAKSEELLKLIGNILEMAKIESSAVQLDVSEVDPAGLIEEAVGTLRPQAVKKGVRLVTYARPDMCSIEADADKLRQALVNIVSNAVKFTDQGGLVLVSADLVEEFGGEPETEAERVFGAVPKVWARFTVVDDGIGIPAEQLDRIFLSFYQVDGSTTRGYGGAGLGLSIAKALVEAHRGRVLVKSSLGMGSQFTILVPTSSA